MKISVVGSRGYVGQHLMQALPLQLDGVEMEGLSRSDADLTDASAVDVLAGRWDANTRVVICAGVKSNFGDTLENYGKNMLLIQNICEALTEARVSNVFFFSSIAVYGVDVDSPKINESSPVVTDTYYGLAKATSESLLRLAVEGTSGRLACLRFPTIYGPGEHILAPTPSGFLRSLSEDGEIKLWGDGSELREFLYLDDVSRCVAGLIVRDFTGSLNIGGSQGRSYRDAAEIAESIVGRKDCIHERPRTKERVSKVYDGALLRSLLPDFEFTSLEKGMQATWEGNQ